MGALTSAAEIAQAERRTVSRQLWAQSEAMSLYALASGLRVPAQVLQTIEELEDQCNPGLSAVSVEAAVPRPDLIRRLAHAHDQLAQIVAPATPRTLLLLRLERESAGFWRFLGAVRLVRQMMVAGVLSLVVFVLTATSPDINRTSGDIFNSSGTVLLLNEAFFLSAAGVGAAFAALFTANRYVANGTYDPKYESSYWVRFFLGIIAGIVMATLIPVGQDGQAFTRPLLALLGGFSASVVYRILDRLVSTLESLMHDVGDVAAAREEKAKAVAASQRAEDQLELGAALIKLREEAGVAGGPSVLLAGLDRIVEELLPATPADKRAYSTPSGPSQPEESRTGQV